MRNVLHVIDHLGLGGAQTIVRDLVEKNEFHRVFALRGASNEVKFGSKFKSKVDIFDSWGRFDLRPVFVLNSYVKKYKIDVLHVHLSKAIFVVFLYKLLFFNDVKVVVHEHGAVFAPHRWFYRFVLRRISRYVVCFVAVSKQTKKALVEVAKLDSRKIFVVYNFIDFSGLDFMSDSEKKSFRKSLGLNEDDFVVGFAGRLHGVKFVNTLIDSYKFFRDDKTKIVIAGSGEESDNLKRLAKDEKNIIFLGFREDVRKFYQILDVFVLPSRSEASPMAFYESQVYGVPFVGSNVYAINEFIQDGFNGFLFKFEDSKDLASKILKIRDSKKLRDSLSKNALSNLKQFDIKVYNKRMEEIYSK